MATGKSISGVTVSVGDNVTLVGHVTAITGSGATATVTVALLNSGLAVVGQANDLYNASSSTT